MNEYKISKESIDAAIAKMPVEGYKSPIELIMEQTSNAFKKETERAILEVCADVGVRVDRDELIRALGYDRQQYEIGFRNGLRAVKKFGHWRRRLVNRYGYPETVIVCSECEKEFAVVFVRALVDQDEFPSCPKCGAQMLENEEAEK